MRRDMKIYKRYTKYSVYSLSLCGETSLCLMWTDERLFRLESTQKEGKNLVTSTARGPTGPGGHTRALRIPVITALRAARN
jgi:hypothetical protein